MNFEIIEKIIERYNVGLIFLIPILSLVLFLFFFQKYTEDFLNNKFEDDSQLFTQVLGESMEESTTGNDYIFLESFLDTLVNKNKDIVYIIIFSNEGNIMLSTMQSVVTMEQAEVKKLFPIEKLSMGNVIIIKSPKPFIRNILQNEKEEAHKDIIEDKKNFSQFKNLNSLASIDAMSESLKKEVENKFLYEKNLYSFKSKAEMDKNTVQIDKITKQILKNTMETEKISLLINELKYLRQLYKTLDEKETILKRIPSDNMIYEVNASIGKSSGELKIAFSPLNTRNIVNNARITSVIIGLVLLVMGISITLKLSMDRLELENINKNLQEALLHKTKFLNNMSHELRTPLNAIIGFSDMLTAQYFGILNKKQLEYMSNIKTGAVHLLSIVNDILEIARIDSGNLECQLEEASINKIIMEAMQLMKNQFTSKKISFSNTFDAKEDIVVVDIRKTKQIILNLLSNACKFTAEGGSVKILTETTDNFTITISIIDTGCGIPEEDLENIFSEFYQTEKSRILALGGVGIGLSLTKKLVEAQGGNIGVESKLNYGSKFWFTVPAKTL